jgi:hypothetical protein
LSIITHIYNDICIFHVRADKNAKLSKVWKATNQSRVVGAKVDLNLKFNKQIQIQQKLHISSQSKHFICQNKTQHISQSFVKPGSTLSALCRKKAPKTRQTELDGA